MDNSVDVLEWPNSLNPTLDSILIKHLWKDLRMSVLQQSPSSQSLGGSAERNIPKSVCAELLVSYPREVKYMKIKK